MHSFSKPLVSLTTQAQHFMLESELFFAPRSRLRFSDISKATELVISQAGKANIIERHLDSYQERNILVYRLHQLVSLAARVTANFAINIFVPPIGLIYHAGKAFIHRDVVDLRDQHLSCAKVELVRVAMWATLVARIAFPHFHLASSGSFILNCMRACMTLSRFTTLFVAVWDTLLGSLKPKGLTLLQLFLETDAHMQFFAKMGLKSELGMDQKDGGRFTLKKAIKACESRIQQATVHLYELLDEAGMIEDNKQTSSSLLKFLKKNPQWRDIDDAELVLKYCTDIKRYGALHARLQVYTQEEFKPFVAHLDASEPADLNSKAWQDVLIQAREAIVKINAEDNKALVDYREFKKRVFIADVAPEDLLRLDDISLTKSQVKKAFQGLALVLHPDKHSGSSVKIQEEAGELFKVLTTAAEALLSLAVEH